MLHVVVFRRLRALCAVVALWSVTVTCFLTPHPSAAATFGILHEFSGGADDGAYPHGSLTLYGSTLYGMAQAGGLDGAGTIFSINTDGTDFTLLHEFSGGADDGSSPYGSLTLSGATLYGATYSGGNDNVGTIFSINTDGTDFTLLHEFSGGTDDGSSPYGSLTLSGATLYGATSSGGDDGTGTIFSINTDGTDFTLLHEFTGGADDGAYPYGSLTLSGATLYGATYSGGNDNVGTIFSINTDGTDFTLLHEFSGDDGNYPSYYDGHLLLMDSTLYGMAQAGGLGDAGTIFSINTDGTDFTLLHSFLGGGDDGYYPFSSSLTLSGSTLYGATNSGGDDGTGTIFSINTDGTDFTLLHEFTDDADAGAYPYGSLTLSGSTLYGMTRRGGEDDVGTIFSLADAVPLPSPTITSVTGSNPQVRIGGQSVTINGSGFVMGATVTVGGSSATSVAFLSPTVLTATAPAMAPGSYDVVVTNPDMQSATCSACMSYEAPNGGAIPPGGGNFTPYSPFTPHVTQPAESPAGTGDASIAVPSFQRDLALERRAIRAFTRIASRLPSSSRDWTAIHHLAYGNAIPRSLIAERRALVPFARVFRRLPRSAEDWRVVHVLGYLLTAL